MTAKMKRRDFITLARRRGGGMAARGGRAAGEAADHRSFRHHVALGLAAVDHRLRGTVARTRLDRCPHRRDRISLGGGTTRPAELEVVEGMQFDRGYISPYFVTNADKMRVAARPAAQARLQGSLGAGLGWRLKVLHTCGGISVG